MITERPAAVNTVDTLLIYVNLPKTWRDQIPGWLWKKKVENATSKSRLTAERSEPLFKGEAIDTYFSVDDLTRRNWIASHVHIMVREHGGFRLRVTFVPRRFGRQPLPQEEIVWVLKLLNDYLFDTMAYHNMATEHLPEHINLSLVNPKRKGTYSSAQSVQIFRGELMLIHDPS